MSVNNLSREPSAPLFLQSGGIRIPGGKSLRDEAILESEVDELSIECKIDELSNDIINIELLPKCEFQSLVALGQTSKKWEIVASNASIWKDLCAKSKICYNNLVFDPRTAFILAIGKQEEKALYTCADFFKKSNPDYSLRLLSQLLFKKSLPSDLKNKAKELQALLKGKKILKEVNWSLSKNGVPKLIEPDLGLFNKINEIVDHPDDGYARKYNFPENIVKKMCLVHRGYQILCERNEDYVNEMENNIRDFSDKVSESFLNKCKYFLALYLMKKGGHLNKDIEAYTIFKSFVGHPIYGTDAQISLSRMKSQGRITIEITSELNVM